MLEDKNEKNFKLVYSAQVNNETIYNEVNFLYDIMTNER